MRFSLRFSRSYFPGFVFTLALFPMLPAFAVATTVVNPLCPDNTALFNPGGGEDIVLPSGFQVSVFTKGLNFPTGIAFLSHGNGKGFDVYVLESGHGLPSRCNDQSADRKSTRLNSSHLVISYAVFCLKKKKKNTHMIL